MRNQIFSLLGTLCLTFTLQAKTMNIQIETTNPNDRIIATLADNPTARDFYNALPLTLSLENYAGVEKIGHNIPKLSTQQAPRRYAGKKGDLTYYAPWGNLAIFTDSSNVGSASGLIYFGRIESGLAQLAALENNATVTIKAIQE